MIVFEWIDVFVFVVGVWFIIPLLDTDGVLTPIVFELLLDEFKLDDAFTCWFPLAIIGVAGTGCFLPFPLVFVNVKFVFVLGVGCADWVVFK